MAPGLKIFKRQADETAAEEGEEVEDEFTTPAPKIFRQHQRGRTTTPTTTFETEG